MAKFIYKSSCSTCRDALKALQSKKIDLELRDMSKNPLTKKEIQNLVGKREIAPFLNTRNQLFRERGYKTNPPSKQEAITEMAKEPNLIKRPLLIMEDQYTFGFDRKFYLSL